jgi:hypothetical protein
VLVFCCCGEWNKDPERADEGDGRYMLAITSALMSITNTTRGEAQALRLYSVDLTCIIESKGMSRDGCTTE